MPSASTAKVDKQASSEALDPIKQGIVLVEHKIRNLMKKKGRLDTYREIQKSGKELDSDQKQAILKYDEVCQNLSFAQELSKQLNGITVEWGKQQKKKEKKEAYEREQQEAAKVKEILIIQDVLANMGSDTVREDFLAGKNKAVQLTEVELQYLDELFVEITPKREPEENQPPFMEQAQNAAKHLLSIVEGKDKEVVGTKYPVLKELIEKINNCGYFDHSSVESAPQLEEVVEPAPEPLIAETEPEPAQSEPIPSSTFQPSVGGASQEQPVVAPINETAGLYISQRPMADVLTNVMGAGPAGFNFIQESELESPDVGVAPVIPTALPIPTQTFTNANFSPTPIPAQAPIPVSASAQPEVLYAQPVPQQQFEPSNTYQNTSQTGAGDWNDTPEPQNNDWAMQVEQSEQSQSQPSRGWSDQPQPQSDSNEWTDSNDGFQTARGGNRGGRGRGGGGGGERGRGGPRGRGNYQNGRGNYQNGRGGGGSGYYRNNDGGRNNEGGNNYYQNGYQPRGDREGYQPRGDREGYQPRGDRDGGPRRGGPRGGGSDRGAPRQDRGVARGGGGRGGPRGSNRGGNRQ